MVATAGVPGWDVPRSAAMSRHILEAAARYGLDPALGLSGTGLSAEQLADPRTEVQASQELAIVRNVIGRLGNIPGLGVEAGSRYSLVDSGILGYAIISSPTLGDAMEVARRYIPLSAAFLTLATEVTDSEAVFVFDDTSIPFDVRQFLLERDLAAMLRNLPLVFGPRDSPVPARLELRQLRLPGELFDVRGLSLTVDNDASRNALIIPAELVSAPMPAADPQTAAICIRQCQELLDRRRERRGVSAAVRLRLIQDTAQIPSMGLVAKELCITERTLHRRLTAENTSFRALLDEVRATLAAELLASGFSVEQTARRLGYSETAAFTRAHTRWSGHPPSRQRAAGPPR